MHEVLPGSEKHCKDKGISRNEACMPYLGCNPYQAFCMALNTCTASSDFEKST